MRPLAHLEQLEAGGDEFAEDALREFREASADFCISVLFQIHEIQEPLMRVAQARFNEAIRLQRDRLNARAEELAERAAEKPSAAPTGLRLVNGGAS